MDTRTTAMRIAAMDGGVVSRQRLLRCGIDPGDVAVLRRMGLLQPIRRGWYATPDARSAVASVVRSGAVLTCVSALRYRPGVWIPPDIRRTHVRWSSHRPRPHFARSCHAHRTLATPIRAVDSLGAALQCAANCLEPDLLVAVLDSTLRMPVPLTVDDLRGVYDGASTRVRTLLDRLDPEAGSGTESLVRYRLRSAHLHLRSQVTIPGVGRVDLLVGDRLIIECDSDGFHNGSARRVDNRRDRRSTVGNYLVLRVDYDEVIANWPQFLDEVLTIVRRGRHLGAPDF